MKLDEAIKHCEEKARDCSECAKEHEQLAQWLKELKQLKSQIMVNDYYPCRYCKAYACWDCRYKMDQLHALNRLTNLSEISQRNKENKQGVIMMKNYISVKKIKAEPCKAWKDFKGHKEGDEGYKIYYPDGYISWCPKDIFEAQYLAFEKENTVSKSDVINFIADLETIKMGDKTTVVQATLKNGFTIIDGSACVDPKNFDMEIGKQCCMEHIEDKIWHYLGFLLQSADKGFSGCK